MANQQKSELDDALVAAEIALERAYAPDSKFEMGAAVTTQEGEIVPGTLVGNVSLGLTMCTERVAMFASIAGKAGRPKILVLRSPTTNGSYLERAIADNARTMPNRGK
jgi:cytidine deaminase